MKTENEKRTPVLDPVDRVSEIIFGLIMALTFTGTISAATAGREEVRTVLFAALGCNLAWGLVDAVMYLIRTLTERTRNHTLLQPYPQRRRPADAHAIIAQELPGRLGTRDQHRQSGRHAPAPRRPAQPAGARAPGAG